MPSMRAAGAGDARRRAEPIGPTGPARERRPDVAGWLRKKWRQHPRAGALADRLDACTRFPPCGSGACPVCCEEFQHDFAPAARGFLEEHRRGATVVCVGLALPGLAVPPGGLTGMNLPAAKRRIQARLDRAGVGWALGAWDLSMNEHRTARYAPFWLPHLHLLTEAWDPEALQRRLKRSSPGTDAVPRPVKVQPWDGRGNALLYPLKMKFDRRVGVDDAERFSPKTGRWRRCRATSHQRLRSAERFELLLHLDEIGLGGRLFLRGAQLRRTRGGMKIVAMP